MNLACLKGLSHLCSAGLLGAIAVLGYDYFDSDQGRDFFDRERAIQVLLGVKEPLGPGRAGLDYGSDVKPAIVEFDWTGAPPAAPTGGGGCCAPPRIVLVPVEDLVEVMMIQFATDDPAESYALVQFRPTGGAGLADYMFLRTGDTLPAPSDHVAILDITRDGVLFSFADESRSPERVMLPGSANSSLIASIHGGGAIHRGTTPRIKSIGIRSAGELSRARTERLRGQFFLGREDLKAIARDYESILSRDIRTETFIKSGKRSGIKVTRVEPGSFAARHGVREGDVIKSINGTSVSSRQEAIAFAKRSGGKYDIWRVEVENLGRTRIEVYHGAR